MDECGNLHESENEGERERVSETGDGEKFDAILVQPQGH